MNLKNLYWLIPLVLFLAQLIFTLNSTNQIRYEELAESVRNPFWLENHTIYDGVSSNVGWYGTLLIIYKTLGFSLNSAKFFRLLLELISLFSLAAVLKKYLGRSKAWIPLLTIGLSPTLLYFNILQTSYGMDLQYFPICLYLLLSGEKDKQWLVRGKLFLLGIISMIAWMSYPTFVYYLPILGLLYFWQVHTMSPKISTMLGNSVLLIVSFCLPVIGGLIYVKDRALLLYDPQTQGGIFRGAGVFDLRLSNFFFNLGHTFTDLFAASSSYYFEVTATDFSHLYPAITVVLVIFLSLYLLLTHPKYRLVIILAYLLLLLNLILSNFTFDPSGRPGIRRNTAVLAAFYTLFTAGWWYLYNARNITATTRNVLLIIILLLPLHHVIVYPFNLVGLNNPSLYQYSHIFGLAKTPAESLNFFIHETQKENLKLGCQDKDGQMVFCRYSEGYAAVAGSCLWNNLNCHPVEGYDPKTKQYIPLSINLWESYYWPH